MTQQEIHARALEVARHFRVNVCELIDILQTLDARKTFREYECTSLFQYAVKHLGLSEDVALNFIAVARKAVEVPALKQELKSGTVTVSKVRKMCSVINAGNQKQWLDKAREMSTRELETEVVRVNPKAAVPESVTPVSENRSRLQLGVSDEFKKLLKQAQNLVSTSQQKAADLETTLEVVLKDYLEKHDPVQKAQRHAARNAARIQGSITNVKVDKELSATASKESSVTAGKVSVIFQPVVTGRVNPLAFSRPVAGKVNPLRSSPRKPIPAALEHALRLRDHGRCAHRASCGARCENTRWLDFHHIVPVVAGGADTLANMTTLCRVHHQTLHAWAQQTRRVILS